MESSSILPLSQLSFFPSKPNKTRAFPSSQPWKKQRNSAPTRISCQKMFVPGFGEASPEAKAAQNLHSFFTFVAVKIVLAQLESYNFEGYKELREFTDRHSLNDGDKFCADLMRESSRHKGLALRILEVRSAYCRNDFEWDNMKKLAFKMVDESNTRLMREYVLETIQNEEWKGKPLFHVHIHLLLVYILSYILEDGKQNLGVYLQSRAWSIVNLKDQRVITPL